MEDEVAEVVREIKIFFVFFAVCFNTKFIIYYEEVLLFFDD